MGRPRRPKLPDLRTRKRRETQRIVEKPRDLELTRRPGNGRPADSLKAAAMASLVLGVNPTQVAHQYGLNPATVATWEKNFDITNPLERQGRLGEMFLTFMEQELISLTAISIATSDEDWIQAQTAGDLAVFVSAKTDRIMKLLEILGRSNQARQQPTQVIEVDE